MPSLIEAIDIKRKTYFEHEGAPYVCLDVEVSRPTARGGQTLVRVKMRNLVTRAVFDRTSRPARSSASRTSPPSPSYLYADSVGFHFMDQDTFETLTLTPDQVGDDRLLLVDNLVIQVQKSTARPSALSFPPSWS